MAGIKWQYIDKYERLAMKVGILGANGRMGRRLLESVFADDAVALGAAVVRASSPFANIDAGELAGVGNKGITCKSLTADTANDVDVLIDFTLPEALQENLDWCVENQVPIVIGTTGLTPDQQESIEQAAKAIPVMWAANYSLGVNVMLSLVKQASLALGDLADIEIIEAHHRHKLDSPSGTAVAIGESIAETLHRDLNKCAIYGREGIEKPRSRETIGFSTIRGGDIVGEHTALFACEGERLEITHKASTRMTFANGAVKASVWLCNQQPGRYSMQDYVKSFIQS